MKDCEGVRLGRGNRQRSSSAYMADKRCKSLPQQSAKSGRSASAALLGKDLF